MSKNHVQRKSYTLEDLIGVMAEICSKNESDPHYATLLSALHDIVCNDACSLAKKEEAIHEWNNAFRAKKCYNMRCVVPNFNDESFTLLQKASEIIDFLLSNGIVQNRCIERMRNYVDFRSLLIKYNYSRKKFGKEKLSLPK